MSKWETEDHFVSWLRLCPDNRISGNRVIGKGRLPTNNRGDHRFKDGGQHLAAKRYLSGSAVPSIPNQVRGAPVAIKAMAAKLARLVYRMLRYGMKYVDKGAATYQAQHRQLQIKQLKWKAATLGYQLIRVPAA
ncbi:MAG: hypothetical protein ACXWBH_10585, partial [Candidatus Angelobacter sp.]